MLNEINDDCDDVDDGLYWGEIIGRLSALYCTLDKLPERYDSALIFRMGLLKRGASDAILNEVYSYCERVFNKGEERALPFSHTSVMLVLDVDNTGFSPEPGASNPRVHGVVILPEDTSSDQLQALSVDLEAHLLSLAGRLNVDSESIHVGRLEAQEVEKDAVFKDKHLNSLCRWVMNAHDCVRRDDDEYADTKQLPYDRGGTSRETSDTFFSRTGSHYNALLEISSLRG